MVEWGGLENRCGACRHRGFESHPLRLMGPPCLQWRGGLMFYGVEPFGATERIYSQEVSHIEWTLMACRANLH